MTAKAYELLKQTNPRIKSYEREQKDADDPNVKIIFELSCSLEHKERFTEFMKVEATAEMVEETNERIRFKIATNHEVSEKIVADFF